MSEGDPDATGDATGAGEETVDAGGDATGADGEASGDGPETVGGATGSSEAAAEARAEVIEAMERSAEVYGLNRSYGRLYGTLFFADGPLSLDELVAETGYAKSTVSTAMKDLERLHVVHRRSIQGEGKKAFYEAERDFWRVVQEILQREVRREIDVMTRALASAEDKLEAADDEAAERDLRQVRELKSTYHRGERLIDVLTSTPIERLKSLVGRLRRE